MFAEAAEIEDMLAEARTRLLFPRGALTVERAAELVADMPAGRVKH